MHAPAGVAAVMAVLVLSGYPRDTLRAVPQTAPDAASRAAVAGSAAVRWGGRLEAIAGQINAAENR